MYVLASYLHMAQHFLSSNIQAVVYACWTSLSGQCLQEWEHLLNTCAFIFLQTASHHILVATSHLLEIDIMQQD